MGVSKNYWMMVGARWQIGRLIKIRMVWVSKPVTWHPLQGGESEWLTRRGVSNPEWLMAWQVCRPTILMFDPSLQI